MKRRSRQIAALLGLGVVVAVGLVLVLSGGASPNGGGAGQPPSYSGSATVQKRNLVSTDTESGTLSYANPQTVYDRLSGTITWLPSAGQLIKPGHALFDINNEPVLLMKGATPAFRELSSSDTAGPDIFELNRNLVDLGYDPDPIVDDDDWQEATTAGVEALQKAQGWDETGTLTLGQIVFLPGAQLIASVVGTIGSTGGGGGSAVSFDSPSSTAEFVSDRTTSTRRHPATNVDSGDKALAEQLAQLRAQLAAVKKQLAASSKRGNPSGGTTTTPSSSNAANPANSSAPASSGSATEILTTNSTQLVVTVDLNASLQSEATLGEHVSVEMPNGSNVGGKVTAVSAVAQQSSTSGSAGSSPSGGSAGSGASATVPVTITLDGRARGAGLDQASVSVSFTQAKASNVLSVPVTSLIATSGQKFAVQETVAPYKLIHVKTGLFAAGYVEISGSGVYQGLKVTDSQG
jgi:hypothetical protein